MPAAVVSIFGTRSLVETHRIFFFDLLVSCGPIERQIEPYINNNRSGPPTEDGGSIHRCGSATPPWGDCSSPRWWLPYSRCQRLENDDRLPRTSKFHPRAGANMLRKTTLVCNESVGKTWCLASRDYTSIHFCVISNKNDSSNWKYVRCELRTINLGIIRSLNIDSL